nr:TetR/AcrR family transcriptional regulator [Lysinibacillus timonensis]
MENKVVFTKKQQQAFKTRKKLLDAGREMFLQHGFQKCTMTQIIKHARVGYGTAYVYFPNKDTLFAEIIDHIVEEMIEVANIPFHPVSIDEAIEQIHHQTNQFLSAGLRKKEVFLVIEEALGLSPIVYQKWQNVRIEFIKSIEKDICFVQEKGLARDELTPAIIARSWFQLNEQMLWDLIKHEELDVAEVAQNITALYTKGLYR